MNSRRFGWTELHPLPQTMEQQGCGLASAKSGLAALREFNSAYPRFGSFSANPLIQPARRWSAAPPDSGHNAEPKRPPVGARQQKSIRYSITSLACASRHPKSVSSLLNALTAASPTNKPSSTKSPPGEHEHNVDHTKSDWHHHWSLLMGLAFL
jgi:hypothetical protein